MLTFNFASYLDHHSTCSSVAAASYEVEIPIRVVTASKHWVQHGPGRAYTVEVACHKLNRLGTARTNDKPVVVFSPEFKVDSRRRGTDGASSMQRLQRAHSRRGASAGAAAPGTPTKRSAESQLRAQIKRLKRENARLVADNEAKDARLAELEGMVTISDASSVDTGMGAGAGAGAGMDLAEALQGSPDPLPVELPLLPDQPEQLV